MLIDLLQYGKSIYSQSGEDGMLEKIFNTLNIQDGWFCEFGSGDGNNISNTRLLRENGWSGVLIEGDDTRFEQMCNDPKISENSRVFTVSKYISCEAGERIDDILEPLPIPKEFDLLSIDVDGNDLWIWNSIENYRPSVVIIEYNSQFTESLTIKYDKSHRFNYDSYYGATAKALIKLGQLKGYDLVGFTNGLNLIFVDQKFSNHFAKVQPSSIPLSYGWPPSPNKKMIPY